MINKEIDEAWNSYFIPGTSVLKNKLGITDYNQLVKEEAKISALRNAELYITPIEGNFDFDHLRQIHYYLFSDIYPFAGKKRIVDMKKEKGAFADVSVMDYYLEDVFLEANEGISHIRNTYEFSELLAKLYTKLIFCHPFREGNGRSIREFIREYAVEKSKKMPFGEVNFDWRNVDKESLNQYIEVAHIFPSYVQGEFLKAIVPKYDYVKDSSR